MKINALYFSCGRDQEMLNLSILSLLMNTRAGIFVASDNRDPVTSRLPYVTYIEKESSTEKLYGLENIASMHQIMADVASTNEGEDYLLKIDSDVLVCSPLAFNRLSENKWDYYGGFPMARESMIPSGHFNGNAYFLKNRVASSLRPQPANENGNWDQGVFWPGEVHNWAFINYPEDMVTSCICKGMTDNYQIDWTAQNGNGNYLFDTFLSRVAEGSPEEIRQYGFAHCRTNPRLMRFLFDKLYKQNER